MLNKGTPAPYTGFLVPKDRIIQLQGLDVQNQEYKLLNESYARTIVYYKQNEDSSNQQINILLTRNDSLSKELASARTTTSFEKMAYFIGGILLSAGAVYGASHLAK